MDEALVLCRGVQYGAAMLAFGVATFQAALAPAALRQTLDRPLRWAVVVAAGLALVSSVAWLMLQAGTVGDEPTDAFAFDVVAAVVFDTQFGRVWLWHLAGAALFFMVSVAPGSVGWNALAVLAALLLASLGLIGHAAMETGPTGWLSRSSQMVHLLASGFWLGALVPLVLCLRRRFEPPLQREVQATLRHFSGLGHVAVAAVLTTGGINVALVLKRWPTDMGSDYQRLLVAKLALVAIMVAFAVANRYVLVPRLRRSAAAGRLLAAFTIVELALGAIVLAVVGVFGTLTPT